MSCGLAMSAPVAEIGKNYEIAFKLFKNAANGEHLLAQYYVGLYYYNGYKVQKDEELAFVLRRCCAEDL